MKKLLAGLLLILLVLALSSLLCIFSGGDSSASNFGTQATQAYQNQSENATATFGAQEFHQQLTAIAEENQ